ncbi:MAG: hypothetical protein NT141_03885 [candidate division WWE3 bacterium]|nr:hypothetical protein [candidate division WWE3 bacterium]
MNESESLKLAKTFLGKTVEGTTMQNEEIEKAVKFQERWFEHMIYE